MSITEQRMPRIPDDFFNTVFYLYPSLADAENGAARGGTGFFIGVPLDGIPDVVSAYAITNRHVIEQGCAPVIRFVSRDGHQKIIHYTNKNWMFDPNGNDLAIAPVGGHSIKFIQTSEFITQEIISDYDFGPGDEAFVIGRFVSHEGKQRNRPTLRFGNIAQMPFEPIRSYRPSGAFEQESFLVEVRSIPGYSGSPVYTYTDPIGIYKRRNAKAEMKAFKSYGAFLLGIDWCHLNDYVKAIDDHGRDLSFKVRANSGMMGVIPAWKIIDLINTKELKDHRLLQTELHSKFPNLSLDSNN